MEIILTGTFGVGKSSIFNRFIHREFTDNYYGTIGVRVNMRTVEVGEDAIELILWDVAGEVKQEKVPLNYFESKTVIIYTVDLSRGFTLKNVPEDLAFLRKHSTKSRLIVVGNKKDLLTEKEIEEFSSKEASVQFDWLVSAKTGENIEELFSSIAKDQLEGKRRR